MRSDDEALGMKGVVKISSIDNCPKDKKTKVREGSCLGTHVRIKD